MFKQKVTQLYLLVWKCWKTESRNPVRLTLQIIWPLLLFLILLIVRQTRNLRVPQEECHFDAKPLMSAGVLPFLQGFICAFNNTCHNTTTPSEKSLFPFSKVPLDDLMRRTARVMLKANETGLFKSVSNDLAIMHHFTVIMLNDSATSHMNVSSLFKPESLPEVRASLKQNGMTDTDIDTLMASRLNGPGLTQYLAGTHERQNTDDRQERDKEAVNRLVRYFEGEDELDRDEICNSDIITIALRPPAGKDNQALLDLHKSMCRLSNEQLGNIGREIRSHIASRVFRRLFRKYVTSETGRELQVTRDMIEEFLEVYDDPNTKTWMEEFNETMQLSQQNVTGPLAAVARIWYPLCNRPFPANEMSSTFSSLTANTGITKKDDLDKELDENDDDESGKNATDVCEEMKKKEIYDNEMSCECNYDFYPVQRFKFLWRMVRPVLKGHVLYYPDTPLVRKIIREIETKVDIARHFSKALKILQELAERFEERYRNSTDLTMLREFLVFAKEQDEESDSVVRFLLSNTLIPEILNQNNSRQLTPENLDRALNISIRVIDYFESADFDKLVRVQLPNFRKKIECFITKNRFEPFSDSQAMMKRAMQLAHNDTLWAAIEFGDDSDEKSYNETEELFVNNTYQNVTKIPRQIRYSIRMDPSMIDGTRAVTDRMSNIKVRRGFYQDMKYFSSGFIYLQDVIDKSIIDIHVKELELRRNETVDVNEVEQTSDGPLLVKPSTVGAVMQQFPYPCYITDVFLQTLGNSLTMYIVLGWIFPAAMIVKSVVLEKERKLREVARIMGISPGLHFLSWNIFWIGVMLCTSILFVVIVKGGRVLIHSSPVPLFLLMMSYSTATISFSFFMSSFFNRANIGAIASGLVFFLMYLAHPSLIYNTSITFYVGRMLWACLLPNIALGFSWSVVGDWELKTDGAKMSNFLTPLSDAPEDAFTLGHAFIMLLFDSAFYYFLAWYIDHVFPGEYGVPRPWYFVFQPSFWCSWNSSPRPRTLVIDGENLENMENSNSSSIQSNEADASNLASSSSGTNRNINSPINRIEPEPKHLPIGCTIRSLVKLYPPGFFTKLYRSVKRGFQTLWRFVSSRQNNYSHGNEQENKWKLRPAVDNLSLNIYEGQITALLGHNGAGKTTTMSVMTGLIPATSGTVTIQGLDVARQVDEVRQMTGFCPQFNVLYDNLTVEEHLWFYGAIRSVNSKSLSEEIETLLKETNLTIKRNERASHLSGGMRRRLSIGVAFIGNSKCVILDEPTAGVDPYARRQIWDLVAKFRKSRTIILSTHHMDEAEILSDRIAILSHGRLQTCGSPLFLKQTFGEGYGLIVVRDMAGFLKKTAANDSGVAHEDSSTFDDSTLRLNTSASSVLNESDRTHESHISAFIATFFANFQVLEHVGHEIHYKISYSDLPKFAEFFETLDNSLADLCISSYGLTDTSLEEIFIKIADETDLNEEQIEILTEGGFEYYRMKTFAQSTQHSKNNVSNENIINNNNCAIVIDSNNDNDGFSNFCNYNDAVDDHDDEVNDEEDDDDDSEDQPLLPTRAGNLPRPVTRLSFRGKLRKTAQRFLQGQNFRLRRGESMETLANGPDTFEEMNISTTSSTISSVSSSCPPPVYSRPSYTPITGLMLLFVQFYALLLKRLHRTRRNWKGFITEIILPSIFVFLGVLLVKRYGGLPSNPPPLELNPWQLTPGVKSAIDQRLYTFFSAVNNSDPMTKHLETAFSRSEYAGTRCMKNYTIDNYPCSSDMANDSQWQTAGRFHERYCICGTGNVLQECDLPPPALQSTEDGVMANPKFRKLRTTDDMLNLTNANVSRYIVNQFTRFRNNFYGGFSFLVSSFGLTRAEGEEYYYLFTDIAEMTGGHLNDSFADNPTFDFNSSHPERIANIANHTIDHLRNRTNGTLSGITNSSRIIDRFRNISDIIRNRTVESNLTIVNNLTTTINVTDLTDFLDNRMFAPAMLQVWYNNKGWPASVAYNNYANNLLLRMAVSPDLSNPDTSYGIIAFNHPLNYTKTEFSKSLMRKVFVDVLLAIMLILAMSFIPASFVIFLIEDRTSDSKHVQMVSGLRPFMYWIANYCWDCLNYTIPCLLCLMIFWWFDVDGYVNDKSTGTLLALMLLYGLAVTPMLYPTSAFLTTPSTAFVMLSCGNLFIGSATTISTYILDMLERDDSTLEYPNSILQNVFLIFPQYCLGRGLVNMAIAYRRAQGEEYIFGTGFSRFNPLDWDVCGKFCFVLFLHSIGWFIVNLLIEYHKIIYANVIEPFVGRCFGGLKRRMSVTDRSTEDVDVAAERRAVMSGDLSPENHMTLTVKELTKVYNTQRGTLTAVDGLTFAVPSGQCFGLLGVNGAGKTTTFRMLTGHLQPTSGSALIHSFDIASSRTNANKLIGYCPQADCITPLLSGRENLEFFARLRGVPEPVVKQVAQFNITRLDLRRHADKPARHYSGGNKRKLSVAISLTGEPPLVFLDEPTAGIDPRARRFLWRAISLLLTQGQSVVLTTHSMDECEALCTRLAIMVNGRFRCLGSPQHLKARFGEGYFVSVRYLAGNVDSQVVAKTTDVLKAEFSDTVMKEWHDTVATFSIGAKGSYRVELGKLFGIFADKTFISKMNIVDFSVTQSSLDAVFVAFAKSQSTEVADADRDTVMIDANNRIGSSIGFENPLYMNSMASYA